VLIIAAILEKLRKHNIIEILANAHQTRTALTTSQSFSNPKRQSNGITQLCAHERKLNQQTIRKRNTASQSTNR
jgi:hypothetical protein